VPLPKKIMGKPKCTRQVNILYVNKNFMWYNIPYCSVVDPNPKKKFGFGYEFGSRHCCRMKICVKNRRSTLERENLMFFYWKNFFSEVQVHEHIWKQLEAPFRKIWGQNISLRIRIRKKNFCGSESEKKVRIHKTAYRYGNTRLKKTRTNIRLIS
jgi:hypothetical protein